MFVLEKARSEEPEVQWPRANERSTHTLSGDVVLTLEAPFIRTCPECRNWNAENYGRKVKLLPKLAAAWWLFILGSGAGFSCVSPMLSLPFADQRPVYRRRCVGHASVHAIL